MNNLDNINNLIKNSVNQYIVRPTGGRASSGINGFLFDIVDDEEMMLDSDITDHYVEDNYAIQDHIALRPLRISVRGYVAEITDLFPNSLINVLTKVQSLASIGAFVPQLTYSATVFYANAAAVASRVGQVINQAQNINSLMNRSDTSATNQQKAFNKFRGMWSSRTLCSVETPFGIYYNMAIEGIRAIQNGTTRFVSDFTVTFKAIRTVSTVTFDNPITNPNNGSGTAVQEQATDSPLVDTPAANPPNGASPNIPNTVQVNPTMFVGRTELLFSGRTSEYLSADTNNGSTAGRATDLNNVPYTPNILTPIFIPPTTLPAVIPPVMPLVNF